MSFLKEALNIGTLSFVLSGIFCFALGWRNTQENVVWLGLFLVLAGFVFAVFSAADALRQMSHRSRSNSSKGNPDQ